MCTWPSSEGLFIFNVDMATILNLQEPQRHVPDVPSWKAFFEIGFRPLYLAGSFWALVSILLWVFVPEGLVGEINGVLWHAHEMLWGFVVTVAVGFLLTASSSWTGITPLKGRALAVVCVLWLLARLSYLVPGISALIAATVLDALFLLGSAFALGRVLYRARSWRNMGIALILVALSISHVAFVYAAVTSDYAQTLRWFDAGLMFMAMLVLLIGRRVIPFFASRGVESLALPRLVRSGQFQLLLSVLAVWAYAINQSVLLSSTLAMIGVISVIQVVLWKPYKVIHHPVQWILYLGYGLTGVGMLLAAWQIQSETMRFAWPIHVIGMGGFSVLILGMMTRTGLRHLGFPLILNRSMKTSYSFAFVGIGTSVMANVACGSASLDNCHGPVFERFCSRHDSSLCRQKPDDRSTSSNSPAGSKNQPTIIFKFRQKGFHASHQSHRLCVAFADLRGKQP